MSEFSEVGFFYPQPRCVACSALVTWNPVSVVTDTPGALQRRRWRCIVGVAPAAECSLPVPGCNVKARRAPRGRRVAPAIDTAKVRACCEASPTTDTLLATFPTTQLKKWVTHKNRRSPLVRLGVSDGT